MQPVTLNKIDESIWKVSGRFTLNSKTPAESLHPAGVSLIGTLTLLFYLMKFRVC